MNSTQELERFSHKNFVVHKYAEWNGTTYLDHGISLHVILETFKLKVEYRRERLEDDTLLGILQSISLRHVLVLTVQRLDGNIVFERLIQVLHALDIKLDIYSASR